MGSSEQVREIIRTECKNALDSPTIVQFKNDERVLAKLYNEGKRAYYDKRLYELKKEAFEKCMYGKRWVYHDCYFAFSLDALDDLFEYCRKWYISYLEVVSWNYYRGRNSSIGFDEPLDFVKEIVKSYFSYVCKISAIEDLKTETEIAPFLDDTSIEELHVKHNDKIWEKCDLDTLKRIFDFSNEKTEKFKLKKGQKENFYNLLHDLYTKHKPSWTTKEELFKPFFERYKDDLSWGTFNKGKTKKIKTSE